MAVLDKILASCIPFVPKALMRPLSARYIAGESRTDAIARSQELHQKSYISTFDLLGEAVTNQSEIDAAVSEYQSLISDLVANDISVNVSLKPTQMGLDISQDLCFDTVSKITTQAQQQQGFVRFEMEESNTVSDTLQVFNRLRTTHKQHIGCVLQAMLFRTHADAQLLLQSDPQSLNVRMVKGIYVEPASIAHQEMSDINAAYLKTTRLLLEGGAYVAVATHDPLIINGLNDILRDIPEARSRVEVQMLLGVQETFRKQVLSADYKVRVYVPYGEAWHKYVTRRLRRNPKLARHALTGMFSKREK
ncbi:MAG: proline dehydrogenase family protein [Planctomycetes bacterium]|nr:proline dehydrogenase family protein [Planctomycetota bacterium]